MKLTLEIQSYQRESTSKTDKGKFVLNYISHTARKSESILNYETYYFLMFQSMLNSFYKNRKLIMIEAPQKQKNFAPIFFALR